MSRLVVSVALMALAACAASDMDARYARGLIAQDGQHTEAEWLASGTLKPRYQAALEATR